MSSFSSSSIEHDFQQVKQIYQTFSCHIITNRNKNEYQKLIYRQIIKAFHTFSKDLQNISFKINDQILKSQFNNDDYENNTYQYLSNSLLRLGECSRKVALKCQNQIFDPFNLFTNNHFQLNSKQLKKLQQKIYNIKLHQQQIQRQKQNYKNANKKLQHQKQLQSKMIIKIQTNNNINNQLSQNQITKFNLNIKKIIQSITSSQKFYIGAIQKSNYEWIITKQLLQKIFTFISYNQQSRNSFCRKSAINCIRSLQEFSFAVDADIQKKIEDNTKMLNIQKVQSQWHKKLKLKIYQLKQQETKEEFVSYEDQLKINRKQALITQQNHLTELFQKVKQTDKILLKNILQPLFQTNNHKNSINQSDKNNNTTTINININTNINKLIQSEWRLKIPKDIPYTFYFIQLIYFKIIQMNSIYCKLQQQSFTSLVLLFQQIIDSLQLQKNNSLNIEFTYKIILISQRLMKKKTSTKNNEQKSQPIELGCHYISKNIKKLKYPNFLRKLFALIQKKKEDKKKQTKSMINNITKGFFAAVTGKKDSILNEDQHFICLQQFANIMSNLSIPTEISLPLIKEILGSENKSSFEYFKSLILTKKDIIQRQKIFYKKQIKEKSEKQLERVIKNNQIAQFCINLTIKRGFLGIQQIRIRQTSKYMTLSHQYILHRSCLPIDKKWPKLIPLKKEINFKQLIHQCQLQKNQQIDQIILLDVNRSLHIHIDYLTPQILTLILKLYSYTHKEIAYCQGMNYIAGYIFIKTREKQPAYRLFQYLMQKRFKQLFANEFQILKIKMYQFERLLTIYHPQISQHFKRQSILPECYIISWMITLFASSYQYTLESYLIDILWERFIISGWREFFKFVLWLFGLYKVIIVKISIYKCIQEDIIQMTYDRALHFFGDIVKGPMFLSNKDKFKQEFPHIVDHVEEGILYYEDYFYIGMEKYHVTNQLLENFKKQYYLM